MKRPIEKSMGLVLMLAMAGLFTACQTAHKVHHEVLMKGHVVQQDASGPIVCIGSKDGAREGQQLTVYRHEKQPNPQSMSPVIRRQVGKVEVVKIFDEHYAQTKVLSGTALNGDSVELQD
ncbi:MAG: hypothetical protein F9K24_08985 [Leptonema illini]|uniref:Lipoprotein n=1 Tax=Leptonema illini TaxID=183 RepID=A0A833H219_9LEPT|nr:MAG: hypothetical protein F9K24_08985 [Leptonema illini]